MRSDYEEIKSIKNLGINHLKSYFSSAKDQNLIQQKFSNISGKTGQYFVPENYFKKEQLGRIEP